MGGKSIGKSPDVSRENHAPKIASRTIRFWALPREKEVMKTESANSKMNTFRDVVYGFRRWQIRGLQH